MQTDNSTFWAGVEQFYGKNGPPNPGQAYASFVQAAQQGCAPAYLFLGHMLEQGIHVQADDALACRYYAHAAKLGQPTAQLVWGLKVLRQGNAQPAFQLIAQAAQSGNVYAQFMLWAMLSQGIGTKQIPQAGMDWLRKAAAAGFAPAVERVARL